MTRTTRQRVNERIALREKGAITATGTTGELWGLTYDATAGEYTLPAVRVAQNVPVDVVAIDPVQMPRVAEQVRALGYNPLQSRLITISRETFDLFPGIQTNWMVRLNPGLSTQVDYNVVVDPATDESDPVFLQLLTTRKDPSEAGA